jgi:hypothetical protein
MQMAKFLLLAADIMRLFTKAQQLSLKQGANAIDYCPLLVEPLGIYDPDVRVRFLNLVQHHT